MLVCIQITAPDEFLKTSFYDLFNAWHQRHFGRMPEYEVYGGEGNGKWHPLCYTAQSAVWFRRTTLLPSGNNVTDGNSEMDIIIFFIRER